MTYEHNKNLLGVVGGIGPLASAEFLKTIYEYSLGDNEQMSPAVVLYSDPTFPDRTETFLSGDDDVLIKRMIEAMRKLSELQVSTIVICCITMHHLLPRLPADLRKLIISLPDVIFEKILAEKKKHLLICTTGARQLGVFQNHRQWSRAKDYVVLPDERDQAAIHHDLIYQLKRNRDINEMTAFVESLLSKYRVKSFIAGCTEIHLLAKHFLSSAGRQKGYHCIDPLSIIAQELARSSVEGSYAFGVASVVNV